MQPHIYPPPPATLEEQIVAAEAGLLGTASFCTFRSLFDYDFPYFGLEARAALTGHTVIDFGSGLGGLAKTVFLEGIDAQVFSINPRARLPEFKLLEAQTRALTLPHLYPHATQADFSAAQRYHDERLSTRFAHDLEYPEAYFDYGIDLIAVSDYMPKGYGLLYRHSILRMLRVIKPGGCIYVTDYGPYAVGYRGPGGLSYKEIILIELGIPYRCFYSDEGHVRGCIIYKR